jgi:hypothetical protein
MGESDLEIKKNLASLKNSFELMIEKFEKQAVVAVGAKIGSGGIGNNRQE